MITFRNKARPNERSVVQGNAINFILAQKTSLSTIIILIIFRYTSVISLEKRKIMHINFQTLGLNN